MALAFNPTDRPQVCSVAGHQIAGGDTGEIDETDPVAADALAHGLLVLQTPAPATPTSRRRSEGAS